jgi:uncharacterized membrane protein
MTGDTFCVYLHRRGTNNHPFYVGKGRHKRATNFVDRTDYWKKIHRKHGAIVEILVDGIDEATAFSIEKDVIAGLREANVRLCNMTDGGEGAAGRKKSTEEIEKIRARLLSAANPSRGKPAHNRGQRMSDTQREKLRQIKLSPDNKLRGRRHSPETISKMRDAALKRPPDHDASERSSKIIRARLETGWRANIDKTVYRFIHDSGMIVSCTRQELINKYKLHNGNVGLMLKGVRPRVSGWSLHKEK